MTDNEKAEKIIELLSPETVTTEEVLPYVLIAKEIMLNRLYPFCEWDTVSLPPRYDMLHCSATIELWNRRGAEGQISHSENGISRTWANSILSPFLINLLIPQVGSVVKTVETTT